MAKDIFRIGVVAPAGTMQLEAARSVQRLAASLYPDRGLEIHFHPQCFLSEGHFAGNDGARAAAMIEVANDDGFDALWFGRGGYGSCRIVEAVLARLNAAARRKTYLGYSDAGTLLGALYGQGFAEVAHGPMPHDILRQGGEEAVARALAYLVDRDPRSLEPTLTADVPAVAFNMAILSHLLGTPIEPDLAGHVLMLEEVSEYMYRIDRFLFHITSNPSVRRAAGLRLGRCSLIPPNDPPFLSSEEDVARYWCERSGIPYLGRADIGHDAANRVVPFGVRGPVGQ